MNIAHRCVRLLLGSAFIGWTICSHADFTVKKIKQGDLTFPVVQGGNPSAAERVNAVTFITVFDPELPTLPPQDPEKTFSALPKKEPDSFDPMPSLDFEVLRNDAAILSILFPGEWCGAYCEPYEVSLAFEPSSGRSLNESDVFTDAGRKALIDIIAKRNQQAIEKQIAKLKATPLADLSAEENADVISMYKECLENWQSESRYELLGRLEFRPKELAFVSGRCSNHAMLAVDDLGDFRNRFTFTELQPWLSPYGRRLLLGEKTNAQPYSVFGQWLHGTIGKTPVTLYLANPYSLSKVQATDVNGFYFYDRYRKPLPINGNWLNGKLALDERGPNEGDKVQAKITLNADGSGGLRGQWQSLDGKKTLEMVLGP